MVEGAGCLVWIPAYAGMTGVGWLGYGGMVVGGGFITLTLALSLRERGLNDGVLKFGGGCSMFIGVIGG